MNLDHVDQLPEVDPRLWGKAGGLPRPYPVICHLLDTAAMAGALFDRVLGQGRGAWLADAVGVPAGSMRGLAMFWAGLHDIGKITPPFQAKVAELFAGIEADGRYLANRVSEADRGFHHSHASQYLLAERFAASGYPMGESPRRVPTHVAHQIAQMLGGHHGAFHKRLSREDLTAPRTSGKALGEGEWERQVHAHTETLRVLIGPGAEACPAGVLPVAALAVLTGLVVCADWLASQEEFITRGTRLPKAGWLATPQDLRGHWTAAVAEAPGQVRAAGLGRARFTAVESGVAGFRQRFPKIASPNPLQRSLASLLPQIAAGPGLLLVTAPTGDGKTEAAELSAVHLAEVSGCGGLAFALPTQASTDAMFRRIRRFASENLDEDASLALVHGQAWLSTDYEELAQASVAGSRVVTEHGGAPFAADWLRGRGRGLHAALGAMTIDQLLLGVLPVKYNMLRLYALSGKVVVIDEAHSYGPWMHALVLRLLEWLGAMRVPVVVMSATLAGQTAATLLGAYRRGCGHPALPDDAPTVPYPGWIFLDAATGTLSQPVAVGTDRPRKLEFVLEPVRRPSRADDAAAAGNDRLAVLTRLLAPLRQAEGRVLVCCNTVAEAQETFDHLLAQFGDIAEVSVLHARFTTGDRARITRECEAAFGPPAEDQAAPARPAKAILVATQIVEQSIDLDFDLVISDLAPIALLLQRAGRCRRHERGARPAWTGPTGGARVIVLDPVDAQDRYKQPAQWGPVYFEALLRKTRRELTGRLGTAIEVPGEVQGLIDAVYTESFTTQGADLEDAALFEAELKQWAQTSAEQHLSGLVALDYPHEPVDLAVLSGLGTVGLLDEAMITTRLGAESARLVLVHRNAAGDLALHGEQATLPATADGRALTAGEVLRIMHCMVPAPGWWVHEAHAIAERPAGWDQNPLLRDLVPVEGRALPDGGWNSTGRQPQLSYHGTNGGLRRA